MPKVPVYLPIKVIEIQLYYEDRVVKGSHSFANLQKLKEFLDDNPEIAEAIGYTKKKKQ